MRKERKIEGREIKVNWEMGKGNEKEKKKREIKKEREKEVGK